MLEQCGDGAVTLIDAFGDGKAWPYAECKAAWIARVEAAALSA